MLVEAKLIQGQWQDSGILCRQLHSLQAKCGPALSLAFSMDHVEVLQQQGRLVKKVFQLAASMVRKQRHTMQADCGLAISLVYHQATTTLRSRNRFKAPWAYQN